MHHVRRALAAVAALVVVPALAVTAPGASADHETGSFPTRIHLPDGWQPEGITTDQRRLFVGSLATGAIWEADPRTGAGRVLWPGAEGSSAVGVDHDRMRDLIWVAGGSTGEVRAHDADTGELVATYTFEGAQFINDLTVTRWGVYATDSMRAVLLVVPLGAPGQELPAPGAEQTVPLTGDYEHVPGEFNLNGIVAAGSRTVLAVQSVNGRLYSIDPATGEATLVEVEGESLQSGDGLERQGATLYVVRNFLNRIVVLRQTGTGAHGTPTEYTQVAAIEHESFEVPTTVAAARGRLYAVNARFGVENPDAAEYWITQVRRNR